MCIAIYKPKNKIISKEILQQCFRSNSDGAGFMYASDKNLHIQKGFFTFDEFYEEYQKVEKKQVVIHFRIKTHGPVLKENCHPFNVNKSLGFVHNGIISGFGSVDVSDTREFGKHILEPLVAKWGNLAIFQPAIQQLIEARIGYSKLIFLDRHGNHEIFNESKGVWDDGIWYSNTSYKPYIPPVSTKPALYTPPVAANKSKLEEGTLITLTRAYYDEGLNYYFKVGEVFEIVAVNSDFTVDALSDDGYSFIYNLPYSKFKFYEVSQDEQDNLGYQARAWNSYINY